MSTELTACGARRIRPSGAGVEFEGSLEVAYRVCLWSRVASRVLLELARFPAPDPDALYAAARRVPWHDHMSVDQTFRVACTARGSRITHTHYAALRVKDAVADHFMAEFGRRPSVDTRSSDIALDLHLRGGEARLALDLCGDPLHRRGYRIESGSAPLRETLASGMLYFADWPARATSGASFVDPMCGSGTLAIEAALMAGDVAPGLTRKRYGFLAWKGHEDGIWVRLVREAKERAQLGLARLPPILGRDVDSRMVAMAERNAGRAGLSGRLRFEVGALETAGGRDEAPGVVVCNPPFGRRLSAGVTTKDWPRILAHAYPDRDVFLLEPLDGAASSGDFPSLEVANGAIACRIRRLQPAAVPAASTAAVDARAFGNRLAKRMAHLSRWARREGVTCYRIYDADLPEFAIAVDRFEGDEAWLHVTEYAAPAHIAPALAGARLSAAIAELAERTATPPDRIVVKQRRRQRGRDQYQRLSESARLLEIEEHGCRLVVNLHDYLDCGLFLDHRATRRWIQRNASGKRFLNLFAYTGAASVHAARGGAETTVSVDLSPSYCRWAARNLERNGFRAPEHICVQADCIEWLEAPGNDTPFDLVFLDPPTFSNSKRTRSTLDVQRDHVTLIRATMKRLAAGGLLVFSCNRRGFKIDSGALCDLHVEDVTTRTLDADFSRKPPPHRCFHIRAPAGGAGP